jgi:purine-nucleoside phosphorylase
MTSFEQAVQHIHSLLPAHLTPTIGIVCGSGLGGLASHLTERLDVDYNTIPGFASSTVEGHAGKLAFGKLANKSVVLMVGRLHYYEGHALDATTFPIRVMQKLGARTLIVTNAAGGLNPAFNVGDLCLILDHVAIPSLSGNNALRGPNESAFGPRFPPLSDAYPASLRQLALDAATAINLSHDILHEAVYAYVGGPSYETPAEARALRQLGGDVVGMSTVPEVIVANHSGMQVLGISLVTNRVVMRSATRVLKGRVAEESGAYEPPANHEEVLAASQARAVEVETWVTKIVDML